MGEIIERVARAICKATGIDPDEAVGPLTDDEMWTLYVEEARAAIEAMREPSEAMEQAYYAACDVNGMCLWKHGYRVMIDAALSSEQEK